MSEHWERLKEIVADALERPGPERGDFVAEACGGDSELEREALDLLAASTDSDFLFADAAIPKWEGAAELLEGLQVPSHTPLVAGTQLGPFEILGSLGEGGFSEVYRARQRHPVDREVAVKLLKPGMDTRALLLRFDAERQTLARMNHPHIARVLDAGVTTDGRPYFVMDLVDGVPINQFVRSRGLSLSQRLDLFLQVCDAVAHAHRRGVIHRDLKPSNVLVEVVDGEPRVQVIDFGISKLIDSGAIGLGQTLTTEGMFLGTPAYASPEQFGRGTTEIDTRSDVYSLGVLLFELLTESRPIDEARIGGLQKKSPSVQEWFARLESRPIESPSTRLRLLADDTTSIASREVRHELDWITARALEFDPERRYPGVEALAEDIGRYRSGDPVVAGPPSLRYRVQRFGRRHRLLLGAASLALVAIVGGGVAAGIGFVRARDARELALREATAATDARREAVALAEQEQRARRDAEASLRESAAVSEFLERLLASARPSEQGRAVTVVELLDASGPELLDESQLPDFPDVKQRLLSIVGNTYEALGAYDRAEPHLLASEALARATHGPDGERRLSALYDLAQFRAEQTDKRRADELFDEFEERITRTHGDDHPYVRDLASYRAWRAFEEGDYRSAAAAFEALLSMVTDADGVPAATLGAADRSWVVTVLSNLTQAYQKMGLLEEARRTAERAHSYATRELEETDARRIRATHSLGLALLSSDRQRGLEVLEQAAAASRSKFGEDHPTTLGIEGHLAYGFQIVGRLAEARDLYVDLLLRQGRELGPLHRQTLGSVHNLGMVHLSLGEVERSVAVLRDATERFVEARGADHPETVVCRFHSLLAESAGEDPVGVHPALRAAFEQVCSVFGDRHPQSVDVGGDFADQCVALARRRDGPGRAPESTENRAQSGAEPVIQHLEEALQVARRVGDSRRERRFLDFLIGAHDNFGEPEKAALRRAELEALERESVPGDG